MRLAMAGNKSFAGADWVWDSSTFMPLSESDLIFGINFRWREATSKFPKQAPKLKYNSRSLRSEAVRRRNLSGRIQMADLSILKDQGWVLWLDEAQAAAFKTKLILSSKEAD